MSMINDALRRASSAARTTIPAPTADSSIAPPLPPSPAAAQHAFPPPPAPPMPQPQQDAPPPPIPALDAAPLSIPPFVAFDSGLRAPPLLRVPPTTKKSMLPAVLITLFVLCVAGAVGVFFWQKNHQLTVSAIEKADEEASDSEFIAALLGDEKAREKIAATVDVTNTPVPVAAPPVAQPAPVAAPSISGPVPLAPRHSVKFPPLRLQSIFYRPSNPSVIINGKTLFVGDNIDGVDVADIQSASVTLVLSGQTNVLTLR